MENYTKCVPAEDVEDDDPPCSYNSMLYELTCMQYIICCLCFSISKPFRKPVWTNPLYFVSVTLMAAYGIYLIFHLDDWSADTFALLPFPQKYRYKIMIAVALDAVASYLYEKLFIGWFHKCWQARKIV